MRLLLLTSILLIASSSCKKQELEADNPMVGKWKASTYSIEDKCSVPSSPGFYDPVDQIKKIEIEILPSGEFISTYDGESEKMAIVTIKESSSSAVFHFDLNAIKQYDCKVRNRKGQVFNFHFYFGEQMNKMVGTYWTPDHPFVTHDVPNHTFATCNGGGTFETEYFAAYQKI